MAIITYEKWYELTSETFNWRGSQLSAVDNALKAYHLRPTASDTITGLQQALHAYRDWLKSKHGANWETYSRNAKGGIVTLILEVDDMASGKISEETRMLRALMVEHRNQSIVRVFGGRKIVLKKDGKFHTATTVGGDIIGAITSVKAIIEKICTSEAASAPWVIEQLGNQFITEMAKCAMPFLGGVIAGGKAIAAGVDALQRHFQASGVRNDHMPFVVEGTASKACEGLITLLNRRRDDSLKRAALYTQQAALNIGGNFFPGGQIVGAASSALTAFGMLTIDCMLLAKESKEIAAANQLLLQRPGALAQSVEIFNAYPILGAYFISFANMNDILSVFAREIGTLHWREVVADVALHHLRPMKVLANSFINESRFQVQGLTPAPIPPEGFVEKTSAKVAAKLSAVTGLADKVTEKAVHQSSAVLNRYMSGEVAGDKFVAEAQPWITTAEAKAIMVEKAGRELNGHKGWTTDNLPSNKVAAGPARSKELGDAPSRAVSIEELRAFSQGHR